VVTAHGTPEQRIHVALQQATYENAQWRFDECEALLRNVQPLAKEAGLRLMLLHSRLELLLQAKRWHQAKRLFSTLTRLAEKSGQHEASINAHLLMGEHLWAANDDFRFEACQAYVAALFLAISESEHLEDDAFIKVGIQMAATLMRHPDDAVPFEELSARLARWLIREWNLAEHSEIQNLGLWPLKVARELRPMLQRRKPSPRVIERLVEREFRRALDSASKAIDRMESPSVNSVEPDESTDSGTC
jgi:hypothetical protein